MFKVFNILFIISVITLTGCSSAKKISDSEVENAFKSWMVDSGNDVEKVNVDKCLTFNPYENGVNGEDSQENFRVWLCNFTAEMQVQDTKKDVTLPFSGCFKGHPLRGRDKIVLNNLWGQQPLPEAIVDYCMGKTDSIQDVDMKDKISLTDFPNKSFNADCDNKDKVCLCVKDKMEQEFGKELIDNLRPYREANLFPRIMALSVNNYNDRCLYEINALARQEQINSQQESANNSEAETEGYANNYESRMVTGIDEPQNENQPTQESQSASTTAQ